MAIEIVDIPINSMVIFHSFLLVHQRVFKDKTLDWNMCMYIYNIYILNYINIYYDIFM